MNKLFQQVNRSSLSSSMQSSFELQRCHLEIANLKEQLSTIGIQHLLKVRQLEQQLQRSKYQIQSMNGIRQILQNQIDQMNRDLQEQYSHNKQIQDQLLKWQQEKNEQISNSNQPSQNSQKINQQQLILLNQKMQLLQLKNQSLIEQLGQAKQQLQISKSKQIEDNNRYQRRIHQLSSNIQRLNMDGDTMSIVRNQNNILHKQLQLKIYEVEQLTNKLLKFQKQQQQIEQQLNTKSDNKNRINNLNKEDIKQYLQQAIYQIEQLRAQNQILKQQHSDDNNLKAIKNQLISIKAEYSNSLKQNNHLIQQNAKIEKQNNQIMFQLQKLKRGDNNKKQKAYITICQQKNQMQIELMNTYQQIEKLNNLLMKKENQIQQLLGGKQPKSINTNNIPSPMIGGKKKDIFVNQGYGIKLVMQNAEQLNHDHWDSIENKIKILKNQNQALKSRGINGYNR